MCLHMNSTRYAYVPLQPEDVFKAVAAVHKRVKGSYAVIAAIAGHGLLAFMIPTGSGPLAMGRP